MDAEDSSDDEGFRPVEGKKRRKLGDAGANGESLEENLLQNNKFGPLAGNDNNGSPAGEGVAPVVFLPSKPTGRRKQPPLVVKNMSHGKLRVAMKTCLVQPLYKLVPYGQLILTSTPEEFEMVQKHLLDKKVEFYTYQKRSEQPHRVVLRGLPLLKPERVKQLLRIVHGLDVLEVHAIKRKGGPATTEETPYIVLFPKGHTNLKKLSEINTLGVMNIWWQAYRNKKPNVTQCRNCLLLGHGTRNCHLKARCNKCGGSHKTEECKPEETQAKRCANCSGAHEAMDRSCPKRAEFIRTRQQAAKPKASAEKAKKPRPPVPELTPEEFPPLPSVVPGEQTPQPGGSKEGSGSSAGEATKDKADAASSQDSTGTRRGADSKAGEEEVLYTWEEVWKISSEYSARLKNCRTRSDQVAVIGYMARKYGSK